ncbi:hypothetical protein NLI96_g11197 [Meripilus lineatus]|uniref:NAD(P)-binding protein n=1 Tax=Meripilus lineatus TaxID=2056292 RepID=A0AAD5UX50_9APHY|nr:hypothetical protein NLI96_g11197 [Physisporinus lineatus]
MTTSTFENAPVWLITGSSQGLGKALLDAVLASGQRAVATLRRPEVLADYQERYSPDQLLITRLDVSDGDRIVAVFQEVKGHFGRLDVVVNNAGYGIESEIETTPDDEARKLFEVLFWGLVNVSKQALSFMRDVNPRGVGGRILNISSITGYSANPVIGFYSAAKFAVEGFTESFNKEMLPEWDIKAIIIEPGGFRTEWGKSSMVTTPVAPQYAAPGTPSSIFRSVLHNPPIGDPAKAAQVMLRIVKERDPPLRLQLGSECVVIVREKAKRTIQDNEKWEDIGHSTNLDGYEKEKVLEHFKDINF